MADYKKTTSHPSNHYLRIQMYAPTTFERTRVCADICSTPVFLAAYGIGQALLCKRAYRCDGRLTAPLSSIPIVCFVFFYIQRLFGDGAVVSDPVLLKAMITQVWCAPPSLPCNPSSLQQCVSPFRRMSGALPRPCHVTPARCTSVCVALPPNVWERGPCHVPRCPVPFANCDC